MELLTAIFVLIVVILVGTFSYCYIRKPSKKGRSVTPGTPPSSGGGSSSNPIAPVPTSTSVLSPSFLSPNNVSIYGDSGETIQQSDTLGSPLTLGSGATAAFSITPSSSSSSITAVYNLTYIYSSSETYPVAWDDSDNLQIYSGDAAELVAIEQDSGYALYDINKNGYVGADSDGNLLLSATPVIFAFVPQTVWLALPGGSYSQLSYNQCSSNIPSTGPWTPSVYLCSQGTTAPPAGTAMVLAGNQAPNAAPVTVGSCPSGTQPAFWSGQPAWASEPTANGIYGYWLCV